MNDWFEDALGFSTEAGRPVPSEPNTTPVIARSSRGVAAYWSWPGADLWSRPIIEGALEIIITKPWGSAPALLRFNDYYYDHDGYGECLGDIALDAKRLAGADTDDPDFFTGPNDPRISGMCQPYMVTSGVIELDVVRKMLFTLFDRFPPGLRPRLKNENLFAWASGIVRSYISNGSPDIDYVLEIPKGVVRG